MDDSAAENEEVVTVDVLDQLDRSKPRMRFTKVLKIFVALSLKLPTLLAVK
jgi:hypothetical protein